MIDEVEGLIAQAAEHMAVAHSTAVQSTITMANGKRYYFEIRLLKPVK